MPKLHNSKFEIHLLFLLWFSGAFAKWMFKNTSGEKVKKPKKLNEVASVWKVVTASVNKISRCCLHCGKKTRKRFTFLQVR